MTSGLSSILPKPIQTVQNSRGSELDFIVRPSRQRGQKEMLVSRNCKQQRGKSSPSEAPTKTSVSSSPTYDAPKDLLQQLESARERSGRSIRLIRAAPPGYEFVHDQMNAYLAASWLAERPSVTIIKDLLEKTKAWQDGLAAQRSLWGFVAAMLDRPLLEDLWIFAGDDERRAVFGRALAERAEREGWSLTRPVGRFVNIPKLLSVD